MIKKFKLFYDIYLTFVKTYTIIRLNIRAHFTLHSTKKNLCMLVIE